MFDSKTDQPHLGTTKTVLPFSGLGHCAACAEELAGKFRFARLVAPVSEDRAVEMHVVPAGYRLHLTLGREPRGR